MNMADQIVTVAERLRHAGVDEPVFIGGSVNGLLLTDPGAPPPRQTLDVDAIIAVTTRHAYDDLTLKLLGAGYTQPAEGPMCRWSIAGVLVDLMPPIESILGFSNRWYPDLIKYASAIELTTGTTVRIASAPYQIAAKIAAFHDRGRADFRFSHDLTDILVLVDGREELVEEIAAAPSDVRAYITETFSTWLASQTFLEELDGHLPRDAASQARSSLILERMRHMIATPNR